VQTLRFPLSVTSVKPVAGSHAEPGNRLLVGYVKNKRKETEPLKTSKMSNCLPHWTDDEKNCAIAVFFLTRDFK
jgi:hypothetical protein